MSEALHPTYQTLLGLKFPPENRGDEHLAVYGSHGLKFLGPHFNNKITKFNIQSLLVGADRAKIYNMVMPKGCDEERWRSLHDALVLLANLQKGKNRGRFRVPVD